MQTLGGSWEPVRDAGGELINEQADPCYRTKTANGVACSGIVQKAGVTGRLAVCHWAGIVTALVQQRVGLEILPERIGRRHEVTAPSKDDEGEDEGVRHQDKSIPPMHARPLETALHQQDAGHAGGGEKSRQPRIEEHGREGIIVGACGLGSRGVVADESCDLDTADEVELHLLELYERRGGGGAEARCCQLAQKCRLLGPRWRAALLAAAFAEQRIQSTGPRRGRSQQQVKQEGEACLKQVRKYDLRGQPLINSGTTMPCPIFRNLLRVRQCRH